MGRYQAIENCKLNPVSLLEPNSAMLIQDCTEIIDEVYSSRIDLKESECVSGRKETS